MNKLRNHFIIEQLAALLPNKVRNLLLTLLKRMILFHYIMNYNKNFIYRSVGLERKVLSNSENISHKEAIAKDDLVIISSTK